jgi:hypothetical protein
MKPRLHRAAPLVAAALLLALPVHAQDAGPRVAYGAVSFTLAPTLGSSVSVIPVAGGDDDVQGPGGPTIAHLVFSVSALTSERLNVPGPWRAPGVIDVFTTADIEAVPSASEQLDQLRTLLDERPDLAPFMTAGSDLTGNELPYLPLPEAGQALRAQAQYIDTPQLSGIAYVAGFRQDVSRFAARDFWYTFQGLSADGTRYVAVTWVLTAPGFPKRVGFNPADDRGDSYVRYLDRTMAKLGRIDPAAFTPSLVEVDALVGSITFEGMPVSEPSPLASPIASASPVPSAAPAG